MAFTIKTYISDGVRTLYDVDFSLGYIDKSYIYVYQGNYEDYESQLEYTWVNNNQIELNEAVPNGETLYIRRVIPRDATVNDYTDGSVLRETELNNSFKQAIMIEEEQTDGFFNPKSPYLNLIQQLNMNGFKAINMGNADIDTGTDAVNVYTMKTFNAQEDAVINTRIDGVESRVATNEQDIIEINKIIEFVPTFQGVEDVKRSLRTEVVNNSLDVILGTQDTGAAYTLNATVIAAGAYHSWYDTAKTGLTDKVYLYGESGVEAVGDTLVTGKLTGEAGLEITAGTTDLRDTQVEGFLDVEGQIDHRGGHPINLSAVPNVNGDPLVRESDIPNQFPVGTLRPLAQGEAPSTNYLLCDGKYYSQSEYPELYAAIGLKYSDGTTPVGYFNVPCEYNGSSEIINLFDPIAGSDANGRIAWDGSSGTALITINAYDNTIYQKENIVGHDGYRVVKSNESGVSAPKALSVTKSGTLYYQVSNDTKLRYYEWEPESRTYAFIGQGNSGSLNYLMKAFNAINPEADPDYGTGDFVNEYVIAAYFGTLNIASPKRGTSVIGSLSTELDIMGITYTERMVINNEDLEDVIIVLGKSSLDSSKTYVKIYTLEAILTGGTQKAEWELHKQASWNQFKNIFVVGNELMVAVKDSAADDISSGEVWRLDPDNGKIKNIKKQIKFDFLDYNELSGLVGLCISTAKIFQLTYKPRVMINQMIKAKPDS